MECCTAQETTASYINDLLALCFGLKDADKRLGCEFFGGWS